MIRIIRWMFVIILVLIGMLALTVSQLIPPPYILVGYPVCMFITALAIAIASSIVDLLMRNND